MGNLGIFNEHFADGIKNVEMKRNLRDFWKIRQKKADLGFSPPPRSN